MLCDAETVRVEIGSPLGGGWEGGFGRHLGAWRLVRCRPGTDHRVAESLWAAGLVVYSPRARWVAAGEGGGERGRVGPLFAGYVFAALSGPSMPPCRHVLRVERVEDQQRLVEDLERLEAVRRSGRPVFEEPAPAAGDLVRVRAGRLEGLEGVVLERRGRKHLVVEVRCLGRLLSLSLGRRDVELLERAS